MSKKAFIRDAARTLLLSTWVSEKPPEQRIDAAIGLAEALWKKLVERGYGDAKEGDPEKSRNWYAELQDQEAFDRCWAKYGREGARNEAAKSWIKLDEIDKPKVFPAIVKYLDQLSHSGTTKAHFSTWLNQRRFESFETVDVTKKPTVVNERAQDIQALQNMIARAKDEKTRAAFQAQLDRLSN